MRMSKGLEDLDFAVEVLSKFLVKSFQFNGFDSNGSSSFLYDKVRLVKLLLNRVIHGNSTAATPEALANVRSSRQRRRNATQAHNHKHKRGD